jgi:hypothetical protein
MYHVRTPTALGDHEKGRLRAYPSAGCNRINSIQDVIEVGASSWQRRSYYGHEVANSTYGAYLMTNETHQACPNTFPHMHVLVVSWRQIGQSSVKVEHMLDS